MSAGVRVGVVAVQGGVREHRQAFAELGVEAVEVRSPGDLAGVEALALPGGESTAMRRLYRSSGLWDPIGERLAAGMPAFGTCAGLIVLARRIVDGEAPVFGALDVAVRRNAFGAQDRSFEAAVDVAGLDGGPFAGVFIRAPWVEDVGPGVTVLARHGGHAVAVAQGQVLATAFHPELTGDRRLHARFLAGAAAVGVGG